MQANFNLKREMKNALVFGKGRGAYASFNFHSQIEIYIVTSGKVEIIINDKRKVLGAGELSVALSYDAHGYRELESSEFMYLIIPTDYCPEFLRQVSGKRAESPFIDDEGTVRVITDAMNKLISGANELEKRGLIYIILGAILEKLHTEDDSAVQPHRFSADILIHISKCFREELSLSSVAREFGYNPSYLSRTFRETFGISFIDYLTMIRLREAVLLLRTGEKSVTECALESGFGSMRSFYRAFHDEFGLTPKEYIAQMTERGE